MDIVEAPSGTGYLEWNIGTIYKGKWTRDNEVYYARGGAGAQGFPEAENGTPFPPEGEREPILPPSKLLNSGDRLCLPRRLGRAALVGLPGNFAVNQGFPFFPELVQIDWCHRLLYFVSPWH